MMTENNVALNVGATGLSGSYTGRLLKDRGWTVVTLSRSAAELEFSDRHIPADLEDVAATAAALKSAGDVTHVFFCTWLRQANEAENVRVNAAMIRNLFDGLAHAPIKHAALVTGLKHYLGSFDDYAKVKPYTPFLESSSRLPGLNFYYAQEDVLFEMAQKRGFTWSVHRPHTMIGFVIGNAMNMAVTLAVYVSICKHTGRPFFYPGSPEQYNAVTDVTDARLLAKQLHWAATTPEAANTPFNTSNGDVFRWTWLVGSRSPITSASRPRPIRVSRPRWKARWPMRKLSGPRSSPSMGCRTFRYRSWPRGGTATPIWAARWNVSPT
jgi:nucleoside-diphosphate-sugar epimerase